MKEIQLSNSEKKTLIDDDDYDRVSLYSWRLSASGYAGHKRRCRPCFLSLARFVLRYDGPLCVDHINRDRLDNRKSNLRIVTQKENNYNRGPRTRPPAVGVCYHKTNKSWFAYVWTNGKIVQVPNYYKTKEEALLARAKWIEQNPIVFLLPPSA